MACHDKEKGRVGEVHWDKPFHEPEASGGDFGGGIEALHRSKGRYERKPWNCPPVCGVFLSVRHKAEGLPSE